MSVWRNTPTTLSAPVQLTHAHYWAPSGSYMSTWEHGAHNVGWWTLTANRIYYTPIVLARDFAANSGFKISIDLQAGGALSNTKLGLFNHSTTTGGPGTLIDGIAGQATTTSGIKDFTPATSTAITAGTLYWVGIWSDGAPTVYGVYPRTIAGSTVMFNGLNGQNRIYETKTYGTWADAGTLVFENAVSPLGVAIKVP